MSNTKNTPAADNANVNTQSADGAKIAALLSLKRFKGPSRTFVTLAGLAGITEAATVAGLETLRAELGRMFPGGDISKVNVKVKGEAVSVVARTEAEKADVGNGAVGMIIRADLARAELKAALGEFPTLALGDGERLTLRLFCGLKE